MGHLLRAEGLSFSWDNGGQDWIHALNLTLEGGQIYGLVGKNGAGKTTLIKLITGCLRPAAGSVHFGERQVDVSGRDPEVLSEIVWVPESTDFPPVSAFAYGSLAGALYPRFSMARFHENLHLFEVEGRARLSRLSFGQRRKAHIAFALATDAAVTVLDEPTNGIDIASQIVLRKLLISHLAHDRALVVSTHHVREFDSVVDRVIVLEKGSVLAHRAMIEIQQEKGFEDLETWYAHLVGVPMVTGAGRVSRHEGI